MFKVTNQWLDANKTDNGGYSQQQLSVFGIASWPPPRGWKSFVVGTMITDEKRRMFERHAASKKSTFDVCMGMIKKLNSTELELLSDACLSAITFRSGSK